MRSGDNRRSALAAAAAELDGDGFGSDGSCESSDSGCSMASTTTVRDGGEDCDVDEYGRRGMAIDLDDRDGDDDEEPRLPDMRSLTMACPDRVGDGHVSRHKPPMSPPPPLSPPQPPSPPRCDEHDPFFDDDLDSPQSPVHSSTSSHSTGTTSGGGATRADAELIAAAMQLYSERDVAILLMAHQAARSARRASCDSASAVGRMSLDSGEVAALAETLPPAVIAEAISIVATHVLLQRFTAAFPYRSGALEATVRRFVQGPVGAALGLSAVGQRPASRECSDFGRAPASRMQSSFGTPDMPYPQHTRRMMGSL